MKQTFTRLRGSLKSFLILVVFLCIGTGISNAQDLLSPSSTVPAQGAVLESLSEIRLAFDGAISISREDAVFNATIDCNGTTTAFPSAEFDGDSGGVMVIKLDTPITTPGNYTVTFPEGSFFVLMSFKLTEEIVLSFTIDSDGGEGPGEGGSDGPGGNEDQGVVPSQIEPENGAQVDVLQTVTLTWDFLRCSQGEGFATIEFNGESKNIDQTMVAFKNGSSNIITGQSTPATTTFTLNCTDPGEYTLKIPAGFAQLAVSNYTPSEPSAAIELHYTVEGGEVAAPEYTVNPVSDSELSRLSEVTVTWGSSKLISGSGEVTLKINDQQPVNITDITDVTLGADSWMPGIIPGTPGNVNIRFNPAYTEPGTYVITIPKGFVTVTDAGAPNGEIVLTYNVIEKTFVEPEPVATPENYSEVDQLDFITIDWGTSITEGSQFGGFTSTITVMKDDDYYFSSSVDGYIEGDKVEVYFYPEITEPGEYEIIFPDDYVIFTDFDEPNTQFSLFYTISGEDIDPDPDPTTGVEPRSIDPENGSQVDELGEIKITWAQKIINEGKGAVTLTHNGETVDITEDVESLGSFAETATTTIRFSEPYTEPGTYVITIPAGFVTLSDALVGLGDPNAELVLTYTIAAPEFWYEPNDGTTPLTALPEEVKVYFGDRSDNLNITGNGLATLTVSDEKTFDLTDKVSVEYTMVGSGFDIQTLYNASIDLTGYQDIYGNCLITLTEGFFKLGGVSIGGNVMGGSDSPEVWIAYVVEKTDGIRGINPETDGVYRVYDLNGVLVLSTDNANVLGGLAKGMYIVNGRKLIVR